MLNEKSFPQLVISLKVEGEQLVKQSQNGGDRRKLEEAAKEWLQEYNRVINLDEAVVPGNPKALGKVKQVYVDRVYELERQILLILQPTEA